MKNFLCFLIITAIAMLSCNAQTGNKQKGTAEAKEKKSATIYLTDEDFLKRVINFEADPDEWKYLGDKPALIDFYTTWCGPCKQLAPILEELAAEFEGKIYVYKVDIDRETRVQRAFGIRSIPTLFFIPLEGEPEVIQGVRPKSELRKRIESMLGNKSDEKE